MDGTNKELQTGIACGLTAALIWGAWPVVSRLGVEAALSPYDVAALRFGVAGLLLLPLVLRRGMGGMGRLGWARALLLACGAGVPYVVVTVEGLRYAPAGHAGIIVPSCMLSFTALGAWLLLGERPNGQRLLGLSAILLGLLLVGWSAFAAGAPGAWRGDLLFVLSGLLWAGYTLGARAWSVPPLEATAIVSVVSLLLYLPPYLALSGDSLLDAPLGPLAVQALFQGVLAAIFALVFYTRAVALLGAACGALFAALVPVSAILLAIPLLGEWPGPGELAGLALVTLGMLVALGLLGSRSGARAPAPAR